MLPDDPDERRADSLALADECEALRKAYDTARTVAPTDVTVLITGENGTGKSTLARQIHLWSGRAGMTYEVVDCAGIPEALAESALFGHVRGAFRGAARDHGGALRAADGGTVLIDEIGELPLGLQAKFLRFLQDRVIRPVGADRDIPVNVRVIAATNRPIEEDVRAGRFRRDLYYRIAVVPIRMPSLCERTSEQLLDLAKGILAEFVRAHGCVAKRFSAATEWVLVNHDWDGNLRELRNIIERCVVLSGSSEVVGPQHLSLGAEEFSSIRTLADELADHKRRYISHVSRITGWGPEEIAQKLRCDLDDVHSILGSAVTSGPKTPKAIVRDGPLVPTAEKFREMIGKTCFLAWRQHHGPRSLLTLWGASRRGQLPGPEPRVDPVAACTFETLFVLKKALDPDACDPQHQIRRLAPQELEDPKAVWFWLFRHHLLFNGRGDLPRCLTPGQQWSLYLLPIARFLAARDRPEALDELERELANAAAAIRLPELTPKDRRTPYDSGDEPADGSTDPPGAP